MKGWTRKRFSLPQVVGLLIVVLVAPGLLAWAASVTHTFSNGTTADATEVNQNFQDLVLALTDVEDRTVFVTSSTHLADFGGQIGADGICQELAETAGLPGAFRAWLGTEAFLDKGVWTPYFHLDVGARFIRTDGALVATGWGDLTDGTIANPIRYDETGAEIITAFQVWTNVETDGTTSSGFDCQGWTSMPALAQGAIGSAGATDASWTAQTLQICTSAVPKRLYCFEQ